MFTLETNLFMFRINIKTKTNIINKASTRKEESRLKFASIMKSEDRLSYIRATSLFLFHVPNCL